MQMLTYGFMLILVSVSMSACSDIGSWKEEVRLSDGRVIIVEQQRKYEGVYTGQDVGSVVRESWMTFKLPEFDDKEIIWHENLKPRILNVHDGQLYIVGVPPTGREFRKYGKPNPSYLGYKYNQKAWVNIPFSEIPEAIYDTNLWIESTPPNKTHYISIPDKENEMRDPELSKHQKTIDPSYVQEKF